MVPGEGTNDVEGYLETLVRHNYTGTITMEINNQMYFDDIVQYIIDNDDDLGDVCIREILKEEEQ